jgi:hypothetical protein
MQEVDMTQATDERYTAMLLAGDDNAWWMISEGHRLNLYEEAIAQREAAEAEVARLRAQVATLRRPLVVIYDLCQFNRDVGKGALLPPSQKRDILDALATTDNSGQDAAGG